MRDARIYLTRSALEEVFEDMGIEVDVDQFLKKSYKYRNKELLLKAPARKRTKVAKAIRTQGDAELFNALLSQFRVSKSHVFSQLRPTHKDWSTLAQITTLATDFADIHELTHKQGYMEYISIGYDLMNKKYRLNKYLHLDQKITERYQTKVKIENSEFKRTAIKLFNYFVKKKKGLTKSAQEALKEAYMLDFILTAEVIYENKWKPADYIDFQFKYYGGLNIDVQPYNLHSPDAQIKYRIANTGSKKSSNLEKFEKLTKK